MSLRRSGELRFDTAFDEELMLRMFAGARQADTTYPTRGFFVEPSVLEEQVETDQTGDENWTYRFGGYSYTPNDNPGVQIAVDGQMLPDESPEMSEAPRFHLYLSASSELQLPVSRGDMNFRKGADFGMRRKVKACTTFGVITTYQYDVTGPKYSAIRRKGDRYLVGMCPDAVGDQPDQLTLSHEEFNPLSGHRRMTLRSYLFSPSCEMMDPGKKRRRARIYMGELALAHDKQRVRDMVAAFSWSEITAGTGNPLFLD